MSATPKSEPVITTATVTVILGLVVSGLTVWGLDLDETQTAWLAAVVGVLAPIVTALIARRFVRPTGGAHRA